MRVDGRLAALLAGMLLAGPPSAFALNPALDVSQYAHTPWKIRDGFTKGFIDSIAQTPDGCLWLGTEFGLLRFDGVRTVPWQPPANQHLSSSEINRLLVSADGTLWIGTREGFASWESGSLSLYAELAGMSITVLLQARDGSTWAGGTGINTGRLCAIRMGSVECSGADGSLGRGVYGLYEDGKGSLWVGGSKGFWRWRPGPSTFYPMPEENPIQSFAENNNGTLMIGTGNGVAQMAGGKPELYPLPGIAEKFRSYTMLRDREGGLWIGTRERGLVHAHQGRVGVFRQSDGLSGDSVSALFEDREGNIWAATVEAQGLEGALRQLVERMGPATKARCEVVVSGEQRPCSHAVEEELLGIAQEAANNANRHAQASEIRIALDYNATLLTLTIADDGRGFDFEEGYGKSGHWGLKNMQERAAQIRGACSITTAVGQGTRIEVCVPLSSSWSFRNTLAKHAGSSSSSR